MSAHMGRGSIALVVAAWITGCGDPEIIVPEILSVDFYPPHGSVQISVDVQGLVVFTHELAEPTSAAAEISLVCLGTPTTSCAAPEPRGCPASTTATVTFDPGGMEARVAPGASLAANTCYAFLVNAGLEAESNDVSPLPNERRPAFRTL